VRSGDMDYTFGPKGFCKGCKVFPPDQYSSGDHRG